MAARLGQGRLPPLVLMTDDERLPDPLAAASSLPRGSLVVLRAREKRRRTALAAALAEIARTCGLFLLIADDPELARAADGVHFPEARMGALSTWRARRPDWFLTASAHSLGAVQRAAMFGADAVFLSPVFPTMSHTGRPALTPVRLRLMVGQARLPVYALGGINAGNAERLAGSGLAGLAAIGGLAGQP